MNQAASASAWNDPKHSDWLKMGASVGAWSRFLAGRGDLIGSADLDAREPAAQAASPMPPAYFVPALAQVHVNAGRLMTRHIDQPGAINLNVPASRDAQPVLAGAVCHESAHARHTKLEIPADADPIDVHWALALEEPRIEKLHLLERARDRVYLRAVVDHVIGWQEDPSGGAPGRHGAAYNAVLVLGRVAAGVLEPGETKPVREEIARELGDADLVALEEIIADALEIEDGDSAGLLACGHRIVELLGEDAPPPPLPGQDGEDEQDEHDEHDEHDEQDGSGGSGGSGGQGQDGIPTQTSEGGSAGSDSGGQGAGGAGGGQSGQGDEEGTEAGSDSGGQSGAPDGGGQQQGQDGGRNGNGRGGSDAGDEPEPDTGQDAGPRPRRMPCGSWTEGEIPEGTDPHAPGRAPQPASTPLAKLVRGAVASAAATASSQARAVMAPVPVFYNPKDAADAAEDAADQARSRTAADAVFVLGAGREKAPISFVLTASSAQDEGNVVSLVRELSRAQYRESTVTRTASEQPPGKLDVRAAMARQRQAASGAQPTARPFVLRRRNEVIQPPLLVGISLDVSGSQIPWAGPVASAGWVLQQALTRLQGESAMVAWNEDCAAMGRPREVSRKVRRPLCDGGSGGCPTSLRALDGILGLTIREGARVAAVVTDGLLPNQDEITAEVTRLARAGVLVMWVTPEPDDWCPRNAQHVAVPDPAQFGAVFGRALAKELRAATVTRR